MFAACMPISRRRRVTIVGRRERKHHGVCFSMRQVETPSQDVTELVVKSHRHGAVGDLLDFGNLMRREEDRRSVGGSADDELEDLFGYYRIESFGRFVENEKLCTSRQRQEE